MPDNLNQNPERKTVAERRRSVRICCTGFAEVLSTEPAQLLRGEIRNVSETGCLVSIRTAVNLTAGTSVKLRFKLGRTEYGALATVVEAVPSSRVRMRFIATDPAFIQRLREILARL